MNIKELWRYRRLIYQLAMRDLKSRYKVSVLGFFWSLLRPLLTIMVLVLVFSTILDFKSDSYELPYYTLLLATYIPWFFFSSTLMEGTQSLLSNAQLVKKVYCPRAVYPAAVVLANLVNFLLSLIVLLPVIYLLTPAKPTWALLELPLIIGFHTAFLFGLCLITSVVNVLYRDTTQVVEFFVFVWFYLSPVLYDIAKVFEEIESEWGLYFYCTNPMVGLLEWYRYCFFVSHLQEKGGAMDLEKLHTMIFWGAIPWAVVVSILVFFLGYVVHKKMETRAVDSL